MRVVDDGHMQAEDVRTLGPLNRAHARGWRTCVPYEPRTHLRGHGYRCRRFSSWRRKSLIGVVELALE
jgi:hypothetical protein